MNHRRARLDPNGTEKPLTRIVHHPPAGACHGPRMPLHRPEYEDASGARMPLKVSITSKIEPNTHHVSNGGIRFVGRDFPISELRIVSLYIRNPDSRRKGIYSSPSMYYMHESQVDTFVEASIKLHQTEGNPHIKYRTGGTPPDQLWEIKVSHLEINTKSYWWCCTDLEKNEDPKGAQLNNPTCGDRIWAHPELLRNEEFLRNQVRLEKQEDD